MEAIHHEEVQIGSNGEEEITGNILFNKLRIFRYYFQ